MDNLNFASAAVIKNFPTAPKIFGIEALNVACTQSSAIEELHEHLNKLSERSFAAVNNALEWDAAIDSLADSMYALAHALPQTIDLPELPQLSPAIADFQSHLAEIMDQTSYLRRSQAVNEDSAKEEAEIEIPDKFYAAVDAILSHPTIAPDAVDSETSSILKKKPKKLTDTQIDRILNFVYFIFGTVLLTLFLSHTSGVETAAQHEEVMAAETRQTELLEELIDLDKEKVRLLDDISDSLQILCDAADSVCDSTQHVQDVEDAIPQESSTDDQSNAEQALNESQS